MGTASGHKVPPPAEQFAELCLCRRLRHPTDWQGVIISQVYLKVR